ncbi:hypothetical protein HMP09_2316 [Sphingomonas sp. HMP9]|uniref:hypothetical protein n=1 Tax=Sphingomonas sp. HMP9 TaxID=1517554 RepID=UPI001596E7BD|nr:hypothetical protein [Sphingomonas sp. HMP9]BCA63082.1 hypothetical protein HMP09_2316 [Sphingomonas sp. HMP9]
MNIILKAASAAIAIMGVSGTAMADKTAQTTYSNGLPTNVLGFNVAAFGFEALDLGSRYRQSSSTTANTETASTTVANSFTLTGVVTKDCSFYGGGQTGHTINLGVIGVRTGNNDNVSIAFNQRDAVTANVNSATAGCNTDNIVTIAKANGSDGLKNFTPGSYDSNQFTDRIPYAVNASWTGVAAGSTAAGTTQNLAVAFNQGTNALTGGAWRSAFNMDVNAPSQSKGLVAGTYSDTITVTLAVI